MMRLYFLFSLLLLSAIEAQLEVASMEKKCLKNGNITWDEVKGSFHDAFRCINDHIESMETFHEIVEQKKYPLVMVSQMCSQPCFKAAITKFKLCLEPEEQFITELLSQLCYGGGQAVQERLEFLYKDCLAVLVSFMFSPEVCLSKLKTINDNSDLLITKAGVCSDVNYIHDCILEKALRVGCFYTGNHLNPANYPTSDLNDFGTIINHYTALFQPALNWCDRNVHKNKAGRSKKIKKESRMKCKKAYCN